uniref:PDZ domain-containing protein n=1 Tax=Rhabditophanes sp. KR3021 TaxID=114890 RepID=A0AC35TYN7_9BILA
MVAFQLPSTAPCPRLCVVIKKSIDQEYGFNLHAEKNRGQFIGAIDSNSPADVAGLKCGDRIFAVNGAVIQGEPHKQVVSRIKENPLQCELLVISEEGADWYNRNKIQITPSLPNVIRVCKENTIKLNSPQIQFSHSNHSPTSATPTLPDQPSTTLKMAPRPRLCYLKKSDPSDEFGFNVHLDKGKGHFIGVVDYNGIAYHAGLETGQRIVGINGDIVYPTTPHKDVVAMIKKSPLQSTLLVAPEDVDKWHADFNVQYSFNNTLPYKPNVVHNVESSSQTNQYAHDQLTQAAHYQNAAAYTYTNCRSISRVSNNTDDSLQSSNSSRKSEHKHGFEKVEGKKLGYQETGNTSQYFPKRHYDHSQSDNSDSVDSTNPFADDLDDYDEPIVEAPTFEKYSPRQQVRTITPKPIVYTPPLIPKSNPFQIKMESQNINLPHSTNNNNEHTKSFMEKDPKSSPSPVRKSQPDLDIFSLSAKEAREMMALNRKKDPRKQNTMTIEQKYQLISSL